MLDRLFIAPDQVPYVLAGVSIQTRAKTLINHIAQGIGERDVHGWGLGAHAAIVGNWQSLSIRTRVASKAWTRTFFPEAVIGERQDPADK